MPDAFFAQIGYGALGGLISGLVLYGILALKVFRLQLAVGTCQATILSMRSKGYAEKRWTKRDELEEQLFKDLRPQETVRYANDPLIPDR